MLLFRCTDARFEGERHLMDAVGTRIGTAEEAKVRKIRNAAGHRGLNTLYGGGSFFVYAHCCEDTYFHHVEEERRQHGLLEDCDGTYIHTGSHIAYYRTYVYYQLEQRSLRW
eukprot:SAG31_NODE_5688_length_2379_cov_3.068860_4_plen_112_part_00